MNLFSAIELGKNSILTQQQVFSVIGHNIANVNTPGYSRQVVDLENVRPSVIGLKDGGRGVNMLGIRSIRDRYIDNQIMDRKQYKGKWETLGGVMNTVETLFDEAHGLGFSDQLTNFFNGWADVANHPSDIPTRNSLVSKSRTMADTMNNTFQRLIDQQQINDANIGTMVTQVNGILDEVAELNQKIAYSEGANVPANDLLDARERRLRELSEYVGVNVYYDQSNNSATVEIAGRPMVSFNVVNHLSAVRNTENSNFYDVYVDQYGQPAYNVTTDIDNGKMGALLLSRDGEVVNGAAGTVTASAPYGAGTSLLTFASNHNLSVGDLITINNETRSVISIPATNQVVINDLANPIASFPVGYQERNGYIPEYRNDLNKLATSLIYNVNDLHQQGYALDTATTGLDFFQMTAGPAGITATVVGSPTNTVTFSADVRGFINVGDAISVNGETRLVTGFNAAAPWDVQVNTNFTANTAGATWDYANVQTAATLLTVDPAIVADSSLIAAADQAGSIGNNGIALRMAQLMDNQNSVDTNNDGTIDNGTFHEFLHSLHSKIGNAGNTAIYESEANGSMLNFLENRRDSISAVSLDEEAANLMQFEKSYTALSQFMGKISQLTDVLMQIV